MENRFLIWIGSTRPKYLFLICGKVSSKRYESHMSIGCWIGLLTSRYLRIAVNFFIYRQGAIQASQDCGRASSTPTRLSEPVLSGRWFYMRDTADAGSGLVAGDLARQQLVKHTLKGRGLCCRFFLSGSRRFYWFRAFEQATEEVFAPGRPEVETQDDHADYKC